MYQYLFLTDNHYRLEVKMIKNRLTFLYQHLFLFINTLTTTSCVQVQ